MFVNESVRAARGRFFHYARWAYGGWLAVWLYLTHTAYYSNYLFMDVQGRFAAGATAQFGRSLVDDIVSQLTIIVLLAAPSFAAGAITDEKVRGTLEPLFLAHLRPSSIVLGKLLARVAQGFVWSLAGWPIIAFAGFAGGVAPIFFVALAIVTILSLLGTCAVSLLSSVWSRTTRDAVLRVYILIGCLIPFVIYARTAGPKWAPLAALDPMYVLDTARDRPDYQVLFQRLGQSARVSSGMTLVCTLLAIWRLRPAFIKQQSQRRRLFPWLQIRPPISDEPVLWKEEFLTSWPLWLGLPIIVLVAAFCTLSIIDATSNLTAVIDLFSGLHWMGLFLLSLAAGARGSATVVHERDRQTWDGLLATPIDFYTIVEQKAAGIVRSLWPYYFVAQFTSLIMLTYHIEITPELLIPWIAQIVGSALVGLMFALAGVPFFPFGATLVATVAGLPMGAPATLIPVGVLFAAVAMHFMAAIGIFFSVRSTNAWLSLLATVVIGYLMASILILASTPIACFSFCLLSGLSAAAGMMGIDLSGTDTALITTFWGIGCIAGLWWGKIVALKWATEHLERRERVPGNFIRLIDLDQPYKPPREQ